MNVQMIAMPAIWREESFLSAARKLVLGQLFDNHDDNNNNNKEVVE